MFKQATLFVMSFLPIGHTATSENIPKSLYEITLEKSDGAKQPFSDFKGKVLLIVNVASRCGFTPQYDALETLSKKYKDQGLVVLGFPSHDFFQEPGTDTEIKKFCETKFKVDFPLMKKGAVRGTDKNPVYKYLVAHAPKDEEGEVRWNFEKFLVDKKGNVVARYRSRTKPDDAKVIAEIEKLLK